MSLLDLIRAPYRNVLAARAQAETAAIRARAEVPRALLVDGQMRPLATLRSNWARNPVEWMGSLGMNAIGEYSPDQLAVAYKGTTAFIGINVRASMAAEIPVHVVTGEDGEADASSPARCFVEHAQKYVWRAMASHLIWGVIYFRKVYNAHGFPTGLEWLNPLDVMQDIDYSRGVIKGYWVTREATRDYYPARQVISDFTFNPHSTLDGTSALEIAMVRSNVEVNIGKFGAAFFANSARPDGLLTFDGTLDPKQRQETRTYWDSLFKGVANAFRTAIMGGGEWKWTPINSNPVDLAMVDLTNQADVKILAVLKVNPILAGIGTASDPLSAQGTFQQIRQQALDFVAIPDTRLVCTLLNTEWLHKDFASSPTRWTLEPDIAALTSDALGTGDRVTTAGGAVTNRVWSINEARAYTGKPEWDHHVDRNPEWSVLLWDKGLLKRRQVLAAVGYNVAGYSDPDGYIYEIDPRAKVQPPASPFAGMSLNLPHPAPALDQPTQRQIAAPVVTIESAPAKRSAAGAVYALLSLANDPQLLQIQSALKAQRPDIDWSDPASFHVTLVYGQGCKDLEALTAALPKSINPFTLEVGPLDTFPPRPGAEPADQQPVILRVQGTLPLIALQAGLASTFQVLCDSLSEYSDPARWQAHVTLGYMPTGADLPDYTGNATVTSSTIEVSVEGAADFETVYITRSKEVLAAQLHELDLWRKRVQKKSPATRFTAEFLPAEVAAWVRTRLAEEWPSAQVFEAARTAIRAGVQPEIGATPAEYESFWRDFDGLQADIREAWLNDYMQRVGKTLADSFQLGITDSEIGALLAAHHQDLMDAWIGTLDQPGALLSLSLAGMVSGNRALDTGAAAKPQRAGPIAISVDWTLLSQEALDFVRQYSFGLIRRIDETTVGYVRGAVEKGIADGLSRDGIADLLTGIFNDPARARLIAQSEGNRVYVEGSLARWENAGVTQARWMTNRDGVVCALCRRLNGQVADLRTGWVDPETGQVYRSSAHAGDRCFRSPIL